MDYIMELDKRKLRQMILKGDDISLIDYSHITDMSYMFQGLINLTSIPHLNVSNVSNMEGMFPDCFNFDCNINHWDVSNVINMKKMFHKCTKFNSPLNNWNVSNVNDMSGMFYQNYFFNQPLNNWNVSNVNDMSWTFAFCLMFNQPLDDWKIDNVTSMQSLFYIPHHSIVTLSKVSSKINNSIPLNSNDIIDLKTYGFIEKNIIDYSYPKHSLKSWKFSDNVTVQNLFPKPEEWLEKLNLNQIIKLLKNNQIIDDFTYQSFIVNYKNPIIITSIEHKIRHLSQK